ncbi:unnamed protein product, partial [Timema podura]|nr:unnamed protein product [Timema podura]
MGHSPVYPYDSGDISTDLDYDNAHSLRGTSSPLTRRSKLEEVTSHTLGGHGGQGGNTAHCLPTVETRCGYVMVETSCSLQRLGLYLSQSSCNGTDTFVKVSGYTPSADRLVLLYSRPDYPVTQECVSSRSSSVSSSLADNSGCFTSGGCIICRCRASRDCLGFVVDYDKSACFRVNSSYESQNYSLPHIVTIRRYNYFQRTCLRIPGNCTGRWWALERVPGYELVSSGIALVSNVPDSERCAELCLNENRFPCRSAMFSPGRCVLSAEDRRTQPDSYRASPGDIEYLENQCIDSNPKGQTCSFQEFPNSSLSYTDVEFTGTTQAQVN